MTRRSSLTVVLSLLLLGASASAEDPDARALKIHRSAIVIDTHLDVPYRLEKEWVDLSIRSTTGTWTFRV